MAKDTITLLLDEIEYEIASTSMLNMFQIGITLKVIEDKLWGIDNHNAQRCNDLQHKLLKDD